jgi:hypothetical protein
VTAPTSAIKAAMSVARDLAEGRLAVSQLDDEVVAVCRSLFTTVAGPDDPLWDTQVEVARGVLAADGIPVDELAEWLAVTRAAAGVVSGGDGTPGMSAGWINALLEQLADEDGEAGDADEDVSQN